MFTASQAVFSLPCYHPSDGFSLPVPILYGKQQPTLTRHADGRMSQALSLSGCLAIRQYGYAYSKSTIIHPAGRRVATVIRHLYHIQCSRPLHP